LAADQRPARAANVFVVMDRRMLAPRAPGNVADLCLGVGISAPANAPGAVTLGLSA
jgi:hypothetical protein